MDLTAFAIALQLLLNPNVLEFAPSPDHNVTCCALVDDTFWCGPPTVDPPVACKAPRFAPLSRYEALLYQASTTLASNCFRKVPIASDPACQPALASADLGRPDPVGGLITWPNLATFLTTQSTGDYYVVVRGVGPDGNGPYSQPSQTFHREAVPSTLVTPGRPVIK